MRNFLAFLAAAVIVLGGVGWYLDWFKLSTKPDGDGHQKVLLDLDTRKVGNDVSTAGQKVEKYIEKDKSADSKTDAKGTVEAQGDNKGIEVKTKNIDLVLPQLPPLPH